MISFLFQTFSMGNHDFLAFCVWLVLTRVVPQLAASGPAALSNATYNACMVASCISRTLGSHHGHHASFECCYLDVRRFHFHMQQLVLVERESSTGEPESNVAENNDFQALFSGRFAKDTNDAGAVFIDRDPRYSRS